MKILFKIIEKLKNEKIIHDYYYFNNYFAIKLMNVPSFSFFHFKK
jgi:hypothetical protein